MICIIRSKPDHADLYPCAEHQPFWDYQGWSWCSHNWHSPNPSETIKDDHDAATTDWAPTLLRLSRMITHHNWQSPNPSETIKDDHDAPQLTEPQPFWDYQGWSCTTTDWDPTLLRLSRMIMHHNWHSPNPSETIKDDHAPQLTQPQPFWDYQGWSCTTTDTAPTLLRLSRMIMHHNWHSPNPSETVKDDHAPQLTQPQPFWDCQGWSCTTTDTAPTLLRLSRMIMHHNWHSPNPSETIKDDHAPQLTQPQPFWDCQGWSCTTTDTAPTLLRLSRMIMHHNWLSPNPSETIKDDHAPQLTEPQPFWDYQGWSWCSHNWLSPNPSEAIKDDMRMQPQLTTCLVLGPVFWLT